MTKQTIGDFKRAFEANIEPLASEVQARQIREAIADAEADARARATAHVEQAESGVVSLRDEATRELTAVRDALDDLATEGRDARVSAADYGRRMADLRQRQADAEGQLAQAEQLVERIETVEADPVAWFDDLCRRIPSLLRDW